MKIGISQRVDKISTHNEYRDSLDQRLIKWVTNMSLLPILIPNNLINKSSNDNNQPLITRWIGEMGLDAIILSGGNNIGEEIRRDLTEIFLLNWARENNIPVLGICRGMQMMAKFCGGSLKNVDGHVNTRHSLLFDKSTHVFPITVNSFHNYSVTEQLCEFNVLARSVDNSIEAIEHISLPWEGWMWHPERETIFAEEDSTRFIKLIQYEDRKP
tara:strand:+ start:67 stop:708 length:642 start_codon:yes stop_codon:yes gene_type:complete